MTKREQQVGREAYFSGGSYDHFGRWASYFYQIKSVIKTNPNNILEIGIGNGIVSKYLKEQGFKLTTADFTEDLNPDIVTDVTDLSFSDNDFDVILCCEVLEHLPFEESLRALREIRRVCGRYAIISIPDHRRVLFSIKVKLPFIQEKSFILRAPSFKKHVFDGQHYWEIGKIGFSLGKIKKAFVESGFEIEKDFTVPENPLVHFFVLKK
ncbi:class I SAM-dependent methyltransferase [Patescibacteria group bacterium]|nr:class I SAM-dependent methyltransferase [Patescibacteria group bacterium]